MMKICKFLEKVDRKLYKSHSANPSHLINNINYFQEKSKQSTF